jgi:hypothetical protein
MNGLLKKYGKWGELHEESEVLAMRATYLKSVDPTKARELYLQAGAIEEKVLDHIPRGRDTQRTYEAFVVSAAALYFKGGDYASSSRVIEVHSKKLQLPYYQAILEEIVEDLMKIN